MREGLPLLIALARSRLCMTRNRVQQSAWPERIGATAPIMLFPFFWVLIGRVLFQDPDFLFNLIRTLGLPGLNRITLSLIEAAFLVVAFVGVQE